MDKEHHTTFLILCLTITLGQCFLDHPDKASPKCVWYGECGPGWNTGKLNCPATATTRDAPVMTDPEGLRILQEYCPSLYNGTSTRTCCSVDQLRHLEQGMSLPVQILGKCSSCLYNFINHVCQMTCSPVQGQFLMPNLTAPKPPFYTTGIPSVTYVVTENYASTLFNSCKDVEMLSSHDKALSLFCGRSIDMCTPHIWLRYMNDINNGRAPFPVEYIFRDGPWKSPDGTVYQPLNITNMKCSEIPYTGSSVIGSNRCSCHDCAETGPCPPAPRPNNVTRQKFFDAEYGRFKYEAVEIKIQRKDSLDPVQHPLPPPLTSTVNYTSIYDKQFMHQVLQLQDTLASLKAGSGRSAISLDDICIRNYGQVECVIESVLQYFQNNASNIDKVVMDQFGFFVMADYLDHYSSCATSPLLKIDTTADKLSCRAAFGGITLPFIVLEGYKGDHDYANATSFVITFLLSRKAQSFKRDAWKSAVTSFLDNYSNPNMSITYTTESLFSKPVTFRRTQSD